MTIGISRFQIASLLLFCASAPAWGQLPDGAGKDTLLKVCSTCHNADVVQGYNQGKDAWSDTISQMIQRGAEGSEDQFNAILDYLVKNFGPRSAGTNVNKATSAELASQLSISGKEADAIVKYRTDNGAFKVLDDLKKVPDLDFKKIESQKDRIVF
jgi:competence ComEA-like helix-hairpin-helix protein